MVDVKFLSRAAHFVPFPLLRKIAASDATTPPVGIEYIGQTGVRAIKGIVIYCNAFGRDRIICSIDMDLVRRTRLSVQRVRQEAWEVIERMAESGGWTEEMKPNERAEKGKEETEKNKKRKNEGGTGTDTRRRSKRRTA